MPFDTWTPREKPRAIPGTGVAKAQRMQSVEMGDGYDVRVGDGVKIIWETWTLSWPAVPDDEADLIEAFVRAKGYATPIWYRVPGRLETKRYVFTSFNRTHTTGQLDGIQIGLKMVRDLEVDFVPEPPPPPPAPDTLIVEELIVTPQLGDVIMVVNLNVDQLIDPPTPGDVLLETSEDALFINFMTEALDPRITFTRASVAYYRGADGLLKQATIDQPRFDWEYDLATTAVLQGLLLEGSSVSLALWNCDLTNAAWTKTSITATKDQTGPDGVANSATRLTATGADGTCDQTVTSASAAHTFSPYLKRITGSGVVEISLDGGATYTTVTLTSSWKRFDATQTLANPQVRTIVRTNGDEVAVWCAQLEARAKFTSPMPTVGATFTRNSEGCAISGVNFTDWFVAGPGSLFIEFSQPTVNHNSTKQILTISDGTAANDFALLSDATAGTPRAQVHNTTLIANIVGASGPAAKVPQRYIMSWTDSPSFRTAANFNGTAGTPDTTGTVPAGMIRMNIGSNSANGASGFAWIRQVQYWPVALSDTIKDVRAT